MRGPGGITVAGPPRSGCHGWCSWALFPHARPPPGAPRHYRGTAVSAAQDLDMRGRMSQTCRARPAAGGRGTSVARGRARHVAASTHVLARAVPAACVPGVCGRLASKGRTRGTPRHAAACTHALVQAVSGVCAPCGQACGPPRQQRLSLLFLCMQRFTCVRPVCLDACIVTLNEVLVFEKVPS